MFYIWYGKMIVPNVKLNDTPLLVAFGATGELGRCAVITKSDYYLFRPCRVG
jgi:hypothetical protein